MILFHRIKLYHGELKMNILKKIAGGFKWLGSKILWVIRRDETVFALTMASSMLPIPALDKIVLLVRGLDNKNIPGKEKMGIALEKVLPILEEYGLEVADESQLRLIIEVAVAVMKKRGRMIPVEGK